MTSDPDEILAWAATRGASDVHFTVGLPPQVRLGGDWTSYDDEELSAEQCSRVAAHVLGEERMAELPGKKEFDLCYSLAERGRFRVNVFIQMGSVGVAVRVLPGRIPSFDELGLPAATMRDLCKTPNGIVLVSGPTGSGKSTTLASMIAYINETSKRHIITIEDPVEFVHEHRKSIVDQREVGGDTNSFAMAMRHVLRQSPDVVLIGEIRDAETLRTALLVAETGHLVLSSIHTGEATQGLSRIVDMFPHDQESEVRLTLSLVLRAMIVQHLLPGLKDRRRVLACEVLLTNAAIRNLIREAKFEQIYSQMHTRQREGMRTMNSSLLQLWRAGEISRETALAVSTNVNELLALVEHT